MTSIRIYDVATGTEQCIKVVLVLKRYTSYKKGDVVIYKGKYTLIAVRDFTTTDRFYPGNWRAPINSFLWPPPTTYPATLPISYIPDTPPEAVNYSPILNLTCEIYIKGTYEPKPLDKEMIKELFDSIEQLEPINLPEVARNLAEIAKCSWNPIGMAIMNENRKVLIQPNPIFAGFLEKALLDIELSPVYLINGICYVKPEMCSYRFESRISELEQIVTKLNEMLDSGMIYVTSELPEGSFYYKM